MPWLRRARASIAEDIDRAAAERTAAAIRRGAAFTCDVTEDVGCDRLAVETRNRISAISILVNNAGIIRRGTVTEPNTRAD